MYLLNPVKELLHFTFVANFNRTVCTVSAPRTKGKNCHVGSYDIMKIRNQQRPCLIDNCKSAFAYLIISERPAVSKGHRV